MNIARLEVIGLAWDLARTRVGSPIKKGVLEWIPLTKSSPVLASGDPRRRSAHLSQARRVIDGEEQALCMGKDWLSAPADFSQTEGARGYAPSL